MKKIKKTVALLCAMFCFVCMVPQGVSAEPANASAEEWEVLRLTNEQRAREGLVPLTAFSSLQQASGVRAQEIVTKFDHTRPNGTKCFTALDELNIQYSSAAENIAAGQNSPAAVVNGWMNSSGHRANIMNGQLRHMGVGYYAKSGSLYGKHWVQLFIGGCTTTAIRVEGEKPTFTSDGRLVSEETVLAIDCNRHGTAYLPLVNADYTVSGKTFTVVYDGFSAVLPCNSGFSDVPENAWYAEAVNFASEQGLMSGIGGGRFDPDGSMTRSMAAATLHRMSGSPSPNGSAGFTDVPGGTWYTDAVNWAAANDIVSGIGNGRFAPTGKITREQLVTMLYRYARKMNRDTSAARDLGAFADRQAVADWSYDAMGWAVAEGIISGIPQGKQMLLKPQGLASRAEAAAVLMRYAAL